MTANRSFLGLLCLGFLLINSIQAIHLHHNNARHHNLGHFHKSALPNLKHEQLKHTEHADASYFSLSPLVGTDKYHNVEELTEFAEQPNLLERGLNIREIPSNPMLVLQKKDIHNPDFLPVLLTMKQDDTDDTGDDDDDAEDDTDTAQDDDDDDDDDAAEDDDNEDDEGDDDDDDDAGDDTDGTDTTDDADDAGDTDATDATDDAGDTDAEAAATDDTDTSEGEITTEGEHTEQIVEDGGTTQVITTDTTVTTEEAPSSAAATPAPAETVVTEAPVQSSDLGNRIDQMSTTLQGSVDTMKNDLARTGTQIQQDLQTSVDGTMNQLTSDVGVTLEGITDIIRAEGSATRQQIAQNTYQLQRQIDGVSAKTDQNSGETINLEILLLTDNLNEKKEELKKLDIQIAQLQASIPTQDVNTCSLHTDCASCAEDTSCGWCTTEKKCVRGDSVGPLFDTCNFYDYHQCSGDACSRYRDCYVNNFLLCFSKRVLELYSGSILRMVF